MQGPSRRFESRTSSRTRKKRLGRRAYRRRLFLESLEERHLLAFDFVENGQTLELRINDSNQTIEAAAVSDGYEFTLSQGEWTGDDSARVIGNGTSVLTVTADGRDFFDTITYDDFSDNGSVHFVDSGDNGYTASMIVTLDRDDAGNIGFSGNTNLSGNAALTASTTRQIVVSGEQTSVTTEDGDLSLSANQQATRRTDLTIGVSISDAEIRVFGDGDLVIRGAAGGTSSVDDHTRIGVEIYNSIVFGGTGPVTVKGTGGTAGGNYNHGVRVHVASDGTRATITSDGGDVTVEGYGGGTGASAVNFGVQVEASVEWNARVGFG